MKPAEDDIVIRETSPGRVSFPSERKIEDQIGEENQTQKIGSCGIRQAPSITETISSIPSVIVHRSETGFSGF